MRKDEFNKRDYLPVYRLFLRWIVNNKLDTTIPTPFIDLHNCWWYRSSRSQHRNIRRYQSLSNLRTAIRIRMKSPERLKEFTNVQKAQLLFILSLEVNSNFENILKNEGHLIELTDPDRRISYFRSNDGTIERRGVHPPARSRNNRANLQPDHEDYNGAQDDELAEHVKLNQQVKRHCRQNLELNQVEEEQGNIVQQRLCAQLISDHRRIKRARIESNQQLLQKNIRAQMGLHPRNQSVPAQRIRVLVPKAAPSTAVRQAVTSQLKTAPVPVEVSAPAKNRVPATATSVNQSVPTRRILVFVPKAASSTAVRQVVAPQVNSAPVPVEVPAPAKNRDLSLPRRISFFRSNDGAIERRGVHQPARSRNNRVNFQQDNEENNGARDDELADEDEQEEMDFGPQNYDDPMVSDDQKDQQLALVMAEEFSRGNEHEHVKLNDQKERNRRQSLELNQENAEEEKGDVIQQRPCAQLIPDRRGIKRARTESNRQPLQEDIGDQIGPPPRIDDHRIPQLHPVGQVPTATAVNQSVPARRIFVLAPKAAPSTAVSQAVAPRVNPAPVPVEVPAPAKNRAPALPRPKYPTPTVSIFLRNLHASFESLRMPVLNGVIETIKKEMKKHQNNTNPVSINYVVASIPTIVHYANQGDPADKNEETISQRRFVEILSQSLVLLNSPEFDTVLATLKEKKYTLNYENKICVKYVKMSVDIFLGAVGDESEKMEVDSPSPQEMKYDVLISLYASVTNLKYISRSTTTMSLIIQAISTHKNDKKPISFKNFETFLNAAILLGETEQKVRKFIINRRVYMETIYHILHIIGSEHVQKFMEELNKTMENLSYDTVLFRMKDKVSDTIKIYRWIIRHKWDVTSPTPVDVLLDGCNKYKDKYVDVYRKVTKNSVRWNLKHHLKKPETVLGFTNEQKVHLMFLLSLPVNEAFETMLKNEGSLIELTDPERLITFFRSRDGTFERRATYTLDPDGNVSADIQQNDDPDDQKPIKKKYQKLGRPKTVFPSIRTTDPLRMLHWLGKHCEYITTPVSASIVCQCWLAKKSETKARKRAIQSTVRNQLKSTIKNPELLVGLTTEQKVQLLFILSLPMNEKFEDLVKHEGHEIELTDPERLITYFRSRDGTIERRATLQLHQGIYEPPVIQLDDDDDDDNFNYEDMEIKQYYDPGLVIKEEPMDEFDPQRVFVKEEPIDNYYDSMDASLENNQHCIKEEPVKLPEAGPSSVQGIKQEPVEQPASRIVPSICRSLRILRASVMALRSPGLAGTQKSIEETLEVHRNNTNPVSITDIAVNLSSIIYLGIKGDPKNNEEEQISRKVYLQFLLQFVILLNSNDLKKFQEDLEQKIDQLDDAAKIRLENVKNGLSTLLVAVTA